MKLDLQNLIETPSRTRFGTQTRNTAAGTPGEDKLGDTLLRQMQQMKESRQGVARLNTFTRSAKQAAISKAGMLKQRLEMLKEMLLHASPEAAKSLARELKSIAHELASLAKSVGGASSSSVATTENATEETATETTSAEIDSTAVDVASEELAGATAGNEEAAASEDTEPASDRKSGTSLESGERDGDEDDDTLRAILLKAKRLLKEVINQLKAKIDAGDEEAKRDFEAAEKSLGKLDQSLAGGAQSSFYTASGISGVTSMGSGVSLTAGLSGVSIDVNA